MRNAISRVETGGLYSPEAVEHAADVFVRSQVSEKTKEAYRYDLTKWFRWWEGKDEWPTVEDALDFRDFLEKTLSGRSAARIFNTVRSFFRHLGVYNPFERLKAPKRVKNATPEVPDDILVIKMLDLVDNSRDRLVLTLLLNGLRRNEVATLPAGSIEWSAAYGCDIIKVIGKGNKERLVPANRETSLAFRANGEGDHWVFPFADHPQHEGHITPRNVEYICEKWSKKAGKKISPHKLRHHYATRMVRSDVDVFSLANLMGHESVSTTQVYVRLDLDDAVKAAAKDPLNLVVEEKA